MQRVSIWIDRDLQKALDTLTFPSTPTATKIRTLAAVAMRELEQTNLPPFLVDIAPTIYRAVSQRPITMRLLDRLPQIVDRYLEQLQVPTARRAKTFAILLQLSPLMRLSLLIAGSNQEGSACTDAGNVTEQV